MIFKSKQINLDSKPWSVFPDKESGLPSFRVADPAFIDTIPHREKIDFLVEHDPRPEFEPTRDPEPWEWSEENYYTKEKPRKALGDTRVLKRRGHWVWAPRRELFDTPVNTVLEMWRNEWSDWSAEEVLRYFDRMDPLDVVKYYTPAEVEHARKVLTRLLT